MAKHRRGKKRTIESAGEALMAALGELGLTDQAKRLLIGQCWPKIVGADIASHTEPDGFSRGVLRIRASSAAWQNELTFLKGEVKDRLNRLLGSAMVQDIRIVSGTIHPRRVETPPAWLTEPPTPRDQAAASSCGGAIPDAELRGEFEHLMCLHLRAVRQR